MEKAAAKPPLPHDLILESRSGCCIAAPKVPR